MLLHFDGENNSTKIYDDSQYRHRFTASGNAKLTTSISAFDGMSSLILDGTNGQRMTTEATTTTDIGTKSFQIDALVYCDPTVTVSDNCILGLGSTTYYLAYEWRFAITSEGIHFYHGTRGINQAHLVLFYPDGFAINDYRGEFVAVSIARDKNGLWMGWVNGVRCMSYKFSSLNGGIYYGAVTTGYHVNTVNLGTGIITGQTLAVGGFVPGPSVVWKGCIAELRFTLNQCRSVHANYTVPEVPYNPTDIIYAPDVKASSVTSLVRFSQATNLYDLADERPISWSVTGSPTYSNGHAVLNGYDQGFYATDNNLAFGSGDFSIEGTFLLSGNSTGDVDTAIFDDRISEPSQALSISVYSSTKPQASKPYVYFDGNAIIVGNAINYNQEYAWQLERKNNVLRLFIDGVVVGSATNATNFTQTTRYIGRRFAPIDGKFYTPNGYLGDIRTTIGSARYAGDYDPLPAFPSIGSPPSP